MDQHCQGIEADSDAMTSELVCSTHKDMNFVQ